MQMNIDERLSAYGNYTRYIRPGFTRVEIKGGEACHAVVFRGEENGKQKLVVVLINDGGSEKNFHQNGCFGDYRTIQAYETSAGKDLAKIAEREDNTAFALTPQSVTTIVFTSE